MLYTSFKFLLFFPIVCLFYFLFKKEKTRKIWLLISSYFFYMCWNPYYTLLLLFSTIVTYLSGTFISRYPKNKKVFLILSLVINIGILFFFKYSNFFIDNLNIIFSIFNVNLANHLDILLPIGISFYTFQALSYTMDIYRGDVKEEKSFLDYALFVSFFPQLVSGPIEKSKDFLPQLKIKHNFDYDRVKKGLLIMLVGFIYKMVVADRIAIAVNTVYGNLSNYSGIILFITAILYSFQIYTDFYGYSLIAKGTAKVLGYELYDNFDSPYLSKSIKEFWRRWHISLSTWFRDYLYFPLGGSRTSYIKKIRNIMIVFLVSGLWHGASWTFVIWGLLHGLYQVIGILTSKLREKIKFNNKILSSLKIVFTFLLVTFAWIFFRASTFTDAIYVITNSFKNFDLNLMGLGLDKYNLIFMFASVVLIVIFDILRLKVDLYRWLQERNIVIRWIVYFALIWITLIFGIYGPGYSENTFIYIQF